MQTIIHRFNSKAEAEAFMVGVDWANDGAINSRPGPEPHEVTTEDIDGDETDNCIYDYTADVLRHVEIHPE